MCYHTLQNIAGQKTFNFRVPSNGMFYGIIFTFAYVTGTVGSSAGVSYLFYDGSDFYVSPFLSTTGQQSTGIVPSSVAYDDLNDRVTITCAENIYQRLCISIFSFNTT